MALTLIPACVFYLSNIRGLASRLDDAVGHVAPVIPPMLPFMVMIVTVGCALVVLNSAWRFGRRWYRRWRYRDELRFLKSKRRIVSCRVALVHLHDNPLAFNPAIRPGEILAREALLTTDLHQLFGTFDELGIVVPIGDLGNPDYRASLIGYLAVMESLAASGDTSTAREAANEMPADLRGR